MVDLGRGHCGIRAHIRGIVERGQVTYVQGACDACSPVMHGIREQNGTLTLNYTPQSQVADGLTDFD
jgi:Fe-S cluster biogenesis protein NfuA